MAIKEHWFLKEKKLNETKKTYEIDAEMTQKMIVGLKMEH